MSERPARPQRPVRPATESDVEPNGNPPPSKSKEVSESPEFDYENDLRIDPNFLDAEFLNHPTVFMKYASESARAQRLAKLSEEKVKTTRSEIIKRCRESGEKHTETTLEAAYRLDPGYIRAKQEWVEATFYADLTNNAVFAFQARKSALENLVRLHGQEYFSTPNEPRDLPEAALRLDELKKQSGTNAIKERMRRN